MMFRAIGSLGDEHEGGRKPQPVSLGLAKIVQEPTVDPKSTAKVILVMVVT